MTSDCPKATSGQGLVVVTISRNRRELLGRLLRSLERQSDPEFTWVVVDDASDDSTRDWLREAGSQVALHVIENKSQIGKCASLNRVFQEVAAAFYLVVDSDDFLDLEGISRVRQEIDRYIDQSAIGAIFFSYVDSTGSLIGGPPGGTPLVATRAAFDEEHRKYDGCVGYFRRAVDRYRYPEFEGEVYCGPTVLQLRMAPEFSICFVPTVIGVAEYQDGGLTAGGRSVRLASPRAMMEYTRLQYEQGSYWRVRCKYLIMHLAYSRIDGRGRSEIKSVLLTPAVLAGTILAMLWRRRYSESKPSRVSQ